LPAELAARLASQCYNVAKPGASGVTGDAAEGKKAGFIFSQRAQPRKIQAQCVTAKRQKSKKKRRLKGVGRPLAGFFPALMVSLFGGAKRGRARPACLECPPIGSIGIISATDGRFWRVFLKNRLDWASSAGIIVSVGEREAARKP